MKVWGPTRGMKASSPIFSLPKGSFLEIVEVEPSLFESIKIVLSLGSEKEMFYVATGTIITGMTNAKSLRNRPFLECPYEAVDIPFLAFKPYFTISFLTLSQSPYLTLGMV